MKRLAVSCASLLALVAVAARAQAAIFAGKKRRGPNDTLGGHRLS
jgi:hypothetical protein